VLDKTLGAVVFRNTGIYALYMNVSSFRRGGLRIIDRPRRRDAPQERAKKAAAAAAPSQS